MIKEIISEVEAILRQKAENNGIGYIPFNNNITYFDRSDIEDATLKLYKKWIDNWNEAIDEEEDGISMNEEFIDFFNEINKVLQIPAQEVECGDGWVKEDYSAHSVTYYEQIEIAFAVASIVIGELLIYDYDFHSGIFSETSVSWSIDNDDKKKDYSDVLELLDIEEIDNYFHSKTGKWLDDFDGVGDWGNGYVLMNIDGNTIDRYKECLYVADLWTEEMGDMTLEEIEEKTGYTLQEYLVDTIEYTPISECGSGAIAKGVKRYIEDNN